MKIFLSGYMGVGKSVVSRQLAAKLDYPLIDLDDQISLIEQKSISQIFKEKGELYFRKLESRVLTDILEDPSNMIVALGGGTPCYGMNMDLIKNNTSSKTIYLKASVEFLTERLSKEQDSRPMISHLVNKADLENFVRKHMFERAFYYHQADVLIDVEGKTPQEIVTEIEAKL
ncbi:shikimate kinase [Gillisia sp. M10.2A]|uniref:Shikimate kinase n=1 Tax=Gillisia lutea TaxID=2909668 RepID=A0ABS9EL40_9FLAO|nr:shikimate kinase [Gillisia lutea]MCF4102495.1 shikimate kinase [Gillisia lutea]